MQDARASGHVLQFAGANHRAGAHAVAMLQRAVDDPGEDLHVFVGVHAEAFAGRDDVFVQDAQRAKLNVLRVEILVERKSEMRIEPVHLVAAALVTWSDLNHGVAPF